MAQPSRLRLSRQDASDAVARFIAFTPASIVGSLRNCVLVRDLESVIHFVITKWPSGGYFTKGCNWSDELSGVT